MEYHFCCCFSQVVAFCYACLIETDAMSSNELEEDVERPLLS